MSNFILDLFNTEGFPPRWNCGTAWTNELGWVHIASDITIFAAYTMIPLVLAFFIFIRKDLPFQHVFVLFIAFIFLCGATHLVEASIFWFPWYRLSGLMKFLTAIVSVLTVMSLFKFIPSILKYPKFISKQMSSIIENAPDAIVITDESGDIEQSNSEFFTLLNQKEDSKKEMNIKELLSEHHFKKIQDNLEKKQNIRYYLKLEKEEEKTLVPLDISISSVQSEQAKKMIFIFKDMTLSHYNRELLQKNKDLDAFAHIASHDLKSPLRAIDTLADFIHQDCAELLPDTSKRHLKLMRQRIDKMENLLQGLLCYARLGQHRYPTESVDLKKILEEITTELQYNYPVHFSWDTKVSSVITHKILLYQVLHNLIENAAKYQKKTGIHKVKIIVCSCEEDIIIEVKDNGIGIHPDYQKKMFNIFERLNHDETEGTGIGLAAVKKILDSKGGKIEVESQEGKGTTFRVFWPQN